ncbi:hypothetical protein COCSADRAFT_262778 [Bipolaris sorokiniana ND90Pr]|uniref:Uncharacterized protein n=1 Tax=Cochliobolus sativus (strain ND90Pr / ATCC 201652) TaxID=665912 RepID=M2QV64_COCSN|nr:uncharacterized protein COCSADRAFT_262778 [Bipolaris sorokiniana ND90Pr]EMD59029.1 hypothetical protein COCSADRAFT_262778 [Bipolaris sorokiniana ND90Pr]
MTVEKRNPGKTREISFFTSPDILDLRSKGIFAIICSSLTIHYCFLIAGIPPWMIIIQPSTVASHKTPVMKISSSTTRQATTGLVECNQ